MKNFGLLLIALFLSTICFAQQAEKWHDVQSIYLEGIKIRIRQNGSIAIHLLKVTKDLLHNCLHIEDTELDDPNYTSNYIFADQISATKHNGRYRLGLPALEADMLLAPESAFLPSLANKNITIDYNADTQLPEQAYMTISRAYEWYHISPVQQVVKFKYWKSLDNGALYPREWQVMQNGELAYTFVWQKIQLNPMIQDSLFAIPEDIKVAYRHRENDFNLHLPENITWKEIASNVWILPYQINVTVIRQTDGLIILEAPTSQLYSEDVLQRIQQKFPGISIKALVTTTPIPSHLAGMEPYLKMKTKIYCLPENESITATLFPNFAQSESRFQFVKQSITLGDGDARIELFPSKTVDNRLFAYLPTQKLLYASELGQSFNFPGWEKYTKPGLEQLLQVIQKQKLEVNMIFGLHLSEATPLVDIMNALQSN